MIKKILVGLGDVEYTASATQQAISLAKKYDAQLTGVTILDIAGLEMEGPVPIGAGYAAKELRESRVKLTREIIEKATDEFEQECRASGIPYEVLHEKGDPFDALVACSRYHDLIICGLKALFEHGVIDEPPVELIRIVKEGVRPLIAVTHEAKPINRVLICYSGSMESSKTMKHFVQQRIAVDAQLRIVTFDKEKSEAEQLLGDAAAYCRAHGYDPEVEHVLKTPKNNVLPYASEWNADLIVLGNSARHLLLHRIFGETTLNVIQNTEIPLFLSQ